MRVFVTGASGHIGSAVVPELLGAGHEVVGLARSAQSAAAVEALGAQAYRADMADPDALREPAAGADAVVHLAFDHATLAAGDFPAAVRTDLAVVRALGDALAGGPGSGSGAQKTFVGIGLTPTGDPASDAAFQANPRSAVAREIVGFAERGVRPLLMAVPPVTHSARDRHGFIPMMIRVARERGVSGYVDEGANHWPAVHTEDLARLFRLALEKAPAGVPLIGAAEEGIEVRTIAESIGRRLGLPTASIPAERAAEHFTGFQFAALDVVMPNASTRELLGWEPVGPGLLAELEDGHYFDAA
jgi:nucleoside-diphosphate-sugar epimerase